MRYLGIDYGARRLGLSISDEGWQFAFPNTTMPNDSTSIDRIAQIVEREHVKKIIVGDTRAVSGAENEVTKQSDIFVQTLAAHTRLPVERSWEAWSSVEAARFAPKGKEHDDAAAAAIILQHYLFKMH